MDDQVIFRPTGIIHSPFKEAKKMPIQPAAAKSVEGTIDFIMEFI